MNYDSPIAYSKVLSVEHKTNWIFPIITQVL